MDTKGRGIAAEVCMMRIVNLNPRAFVLENVVKACTFHGGKCWLVLTNQLRTLWYTLDDCTIDAICAGTPQTRNRVYLIGRKGYHSPITIAASIIEPDLEVVLDPREPGDNQDNVPWGADGDEIATTRNVRRERERLEAKLKRRYDPKFDIKKTERVFDVDRGKKNTHMNQLTSTFRKKKEG